MSQSEKLKNLFDLRVDFVDTLSSDDEGNFSLGCDVEVSRVSSLSFFGNEVSLGLLISLVVFLSLVFPFLSSGLDEGFSFLSLFVEIIGFFSVSLLLSGEGLGNETKIY